MDLAFLIIGWRFNITEVINDVLGKEFKSSI